MVTYRDCVSASTSARSDCARLPIARAAVLLCITVGRSPMPQSLPNMATVSYSGPP